MQIDNKTKPELLACPKRHIQQNFKLKIGTLKDIVIVMNDALKGKIKLNKTQEQSAHELFVWGLPHWRTIYLCSENTETLFCNL